MSRRRAAVKREIQPDAKFGSRMVSKFINILMEDGKKEGAEGAVYGALDSLSIAHGRNASELLEESVKNVLPQLEVRSKRVGGATYQVPVVISPERSLSLALRWIIDAALDKKNEKTLSKKLSSALDDALRNEGAAVKKKETTHKMAEANKAFAHFGG